VRLLIDTDTAADDAVAIMMALGTPGIDVVALTTASGNVPLEQATFNALKVLHVCGREDIPVHTGASAPLAREAVFATDVHGPDGFGAQWYPPVGEATSNDAVAATLDLLDRHPGELTWVALAPLTNLALAIEADPAVCARVKQVVVMGGTADGVGNVTPAAEFNFWADPEAARVVLGSGLPLRIVGCDVARRHALLTGEHLELIRGSESPLAAFAVAVTSGLWDFHQRRGEVAMEMCDPVAMAAALEPRAAMWKAMAVDVHCAMEERRGALEIDEHGQPNAEVCTAFDEDRFRALLFQRLGMT
jgi:purine nucleosidase